MASIHPVQHGISLEQKYTWVLCHDSLWNNVCEVSIYIRKQLRIKLGEISWKMFYSSLFSAVIKDFFTFAHNHKSLHQTFTLTEHNFPHNSLAEIHFVFLPFSAIDKNASLQWQFVKMIFCIHKCSSQMSPLPTPSHMSTELFWIALKKKKKKKEFFHDVLSSYTTQM